jgi:DNA-3-methyladenine glycosylase I
MKRCGWAERGGPLDRSYHDEEWGVPSRDDRHLFEMVILEGAQAGLSWSTILNKRANYRRAFARFDPRRIARFGATDVQRLVGDAGIVRNRAKVAAAIANARATLDVQREHGSLANYLWHFVGGRPIRNRWSSLSRAPAATDESKAMSRDLLRRGFKFVGPTICYAFMQAVGMVNDHEVGCFRHAAVARLANRDRPGASAPVRGSRPDS